MLTNIIILAIVAVIAFFGVRSIITRANQGCCGAGESTKKVRVKDKNEANYACTVKLGIEGMTCNKCRERVENALNAEEGVWAEVDLKENSALVRMKKELTRDDLERVIRHAGYSLTSYETI